MKTILDLNDPDAAMLRVSDDFDPSAPGYLAKGRDYVVVNAVLPELGSGQRYASTWTRTTVDDVLTLTRDVEDVPIPAERQALYDQVLALLAQAGLTGENTPASYAAAYAGIIAWIAEVTTNSPTIERQNVAIQLLGLWPMVVDAGGSWDEGLRYAESLAP